MVKKFYLPTAICCVTMLIVAGCGSRPPDPSEPLKKAFATSRISTISLQFTTADGYLGSVQASGKTAVTAKDIKSSFDISASGANRGFLQCTVYTDSATNSTTVEAPDELIGTVAADNKNRSGNTVSFDGADSLGIKGVSDNLIGWVGKHASAASFSRASSNPISGDGTYTWSLDAAQAEQILKPVLDAMGNDPAKAIVHTVDNTFENAYFTGLEAGGKKYTLQIETVGGGADEISLQSKGFVSPQSLQNQADPWTGKLPADKVEDGLSLSVKIQSGAVSALSKPQGAVAADQ